MITAVDANVLFDVLRPESPEFDGSRRALLEAHDLGELITSEPVFAEVASQFHSAIQVVDYFDGFGIELKGSTTESLYLAGVAWRLYTRRRRRDGLICANCGASQDVTCQQCGALLRGRQHLPSDFTIGAHAVLHADRLLTRDKGIYRTYFPDLQLV